MTARRVPRCTSAHDPRLREAVGAYLLGALEPAEADEVAAHLAQCESCRSDYAELADLVPLLATVTESEAVQGPVRPEPAVLGRVLATSRRHSASARPERDRRRPARPRRTRLLLAAASVVLAAGGSVIGVRMSTHAATPTAWSATVMVPPYGGGPSGDITAMADVTPATWGSKISLKMEGVPKGYKCSMIVVGTDGHRESAGTWSALDGGSFTIPATASMSPDHISSIDVDLLDGTTLLRVTHP